MHEELRRTHHGLEQIAVGVDAVNCEKLEGHHDIAVGERVVHRADLKLHAVREEVAVEMMMQSREHEVDPLLPRTLRLEPELGKHRRSEARRVGKEGRSRWAPRSTSRVTAGVAGQ